MGTVNFNTSSNGIDLEAILDAALFDIPNSTVMAPGVKTVTVVLNGVNNTTYR